MIGSQSSGASVSSVSVSYEPYNRAPVIERFALRQQGAAVSGEALFRWVASDPDLDPVKISLRYRPARSGDWRRAEDGASFEPGSTDAQEGELRWDTSAIDEGRYEIQAIATDGAANPLGEGREFRTEPPLLLTIDRTPPRIDIISGEQGLLEVSLSDDLSVIGSLELLRGGRVVNTIRAEDGMCDSPTESFRLRLPDDEGDWSLRGVDSAGNGVERRLDEPADVG